jgi:hypothetical protein
MFVPAYAFRKGKAQNLQNSKSTPFGFQRASVCRRGRNRRRRQPAAREATNDRPLFCVTCRRTKPEAQGTSCGRTRVRPAAARRFTPYLLLVPDRPRPACWSVTGVHARVRVRPILASRRPGYDGRATVRAQRKILGTIVVLSVSWWIPAPSLSLEEPSLPLRSWSLSPLPPAATVAGGGREGGPVEFR